MEFIVMMINVVNVICVLATLFFTEEWNSKFVLMIIMLNTISNVYLLERIG
jgi:hypothetical protein